MHVSRNDAQKVFMLGEVKRPGTLKVSRYGLNLAEALSDSGGINESSADANGVFVVRKRDLQQTGLIADVYQLHAKNITAMVIACLLYTSDAADE